MDISLFLAQAFGLYFVIAGVAFIMHPTLIKSMTNKFSSDRDAVVMGGFVALVIGIPLVLIHNVWDGTWEVLVTIIVWLTFLKGVVRVLAPDMVVGWARQLGAKEGIMRALIWVMLLLGLYLLYVGFDVNINTA